MKKYIITLSLSFTACGSDSAPQVAQDTTQNQTQNVTAPKDNAEAPVTPVAPKYSGGGWCEAENGWVPGEGGCVLDKEIPPSYAPEGKRLVVRLAIGYVNNYQAPSAICRGLNLLRYEWRSVDTNEMGLFVMETLETNVRRHLQTDYLVFGLYPTYQIHGITFPNGVRQDYPVNGSAPAFPDTVLCYKLVDAIP
ncbi:MAG TPA: hypothetical protein PKW79_00410 [Rhabdochlamydiaceae bacterium]|nr:hypothetical protein [Rhabdochlamydiaceae bacterium]